MVLEFCVVSGDFGKGTVHTKQNGLSKLRWLRAHTIAEIQNNTNNIEQLTRGFLHSYHRTIAAFAKLVKDDNALTQSRLDYYNPSIR